MFLLTRLGLYSVSSSFKAVFDFVGVTIKEHRHTYQEDNMRDLIDCYIREQRQAPTNSSFHGK